MQILIVVVRYKTPPEESQTMLSLSAVFQAHPLLLQSYALLLWDNSPVPLAKVNSSFVLEYRHSDRNLGVSGAYNRAMERAIELGCRWMLLLDQDTTIVDGYLQRMLEYSWQLQDENSVATVVPFVRSSGELVSPRAFGRLLRSHQISRSKTGVFKEDAYAVNSGTLIRVSALREVGGYSGDFWLDLSDAYVFHAMHRQGKWMYIAGDLELPHSIAAMDFDKDMGTERYRHFLAAENLYIDLYRTRFIRWAQVPWLAARAARQFRRYRNKAFARITIAALFERLVHSKSDRIKRWRDALQRREIPVISNGIIVG